MQRRRRIPKGVNIESAHFHQCGLCGAMRRLFNIGCSRYRKGKTCIEVCTSCKEEYRKLT